MFFLPNFTELESLLQLGQAIGEYMLPMVVLGHMLTMEFIFAFALLPLLAYVNFCYITPIVSFSFQLYSNFCVFLPIL